MLCLPMCWARANACYVVVEPVVCNAMLPFYKLASCKQ